MPIGPPTLCVNIPDRNGCGFPTYLPCRLSLRDRFVVKLLTARSKEPKCYSWKFMGKAQQPPAFPGVWSSLSASSDSKDFGWDAYFTCWLFPTWHRLRNRWTECWWKWLLAWDYPEWRLRTPSDFSVVWYQLTKLGSSLPLYFIPRKNKTVRCC